VSEVLVLLHLLFSYLLYWGDIWKTRFPTFLPVAQTVLNSLEKQTTRDYMSEDALQIGGTGVL
jgi:hypothetical protein